MRNEIELKKHIAKINFITQLERIVLYPRRAPRGRVD